MPLPLLELVRFWAWPIVAVVGATVIGLVLVVSEPGLARNLGVSTLAGVVAAVVVIPTQVALSRRAAQVEFERDGQLVRLAIDRILAEMEQMEQRVADDPAVDDLAAGDPAAGDAEPPH